MKKIISLLVAVIMAISLVACGINGQEEAEKTVERFMDAYCEFDVETMEDYIDDKKVIPKEINEFNVEKMLGNIPDEFADYEDELKAIFSDFVERMMETISYEVKDVDKKDGAYIFELDITVPKLTDDIKKALTEAIDKETLLQLISDKYVAGELTDTSTQEDINKLIVPEILQSIENILEEIEIETETKSKDLVVTKQDGKWLIDAKASNLD